jgi:phosphoserine phosphatase RsbU/P
VYALLYFTGAAPGLASVIALAAFAVGVVSLIRLLRRTLRKTIWRLRNRLIAAYLLIAVVPIVLILALAGIAATAVVGQMAVYMVDNELQRRIASLTGPVEGLVRILGAERGVSAAEVAPAIEARFPSFEMLISGRTDERYPPQSDLMPPPEEWQHANGLVVKDKRAYAWLHERNRGNEITLVAPLTHDLLSRLVPGLGDVDLIPYTKPSAESHLPPKQNPFDMEVSFPYPVQLESWGSPQSSEDGILPWPPTAFDTFRCRVQC